MVRLRRVERRFAAAESLRRITRGLPAFTPLKSGERGTVIDAGDPSQALVRLRRTLRDFGGAAGTWLHRPRGPSQPRAFVFCVRPRHRT